MLFTEELKKLEVDAEAHKEDKGSCAKQIQEYTASLSMIHSHLRDLAQCKLMEGSEGTVQSSTSHVLKEVVPKVVVTVAAHTGRHYWTNVESRRAAVSLFQLILSRCGCTSVAELLIGRSDEAPPLQSPYSPLILPPEDESDDKDENESDEKEVEKSVLVDEENIATKRPVFKKGLLKEIFALLKAKLQRDTWKSHPNSKHALLWCLKHLKHPNVEPFLDSFLPPLLMLIDDYEAYHRSLGLSGMTHLIRNTNAAVLRQYGRSEVIYEAVKHLLYTNEVVVISSLHPCLLTLLPIIDGPAPRTVDSPRKPGKADEVFSAFLGCMEMESKLAVRKAYSSHVSRYIETLGIFTVRHLKRLLSLLYSYMEFPDYCGEETRLNCLKSLVIVMKHCWPRIPGHSTNILKSLLKLISDLSPHGKVPDKPEEKVQLPLVTECFVLLALCDTDIKDMYCRILDESGGHTVLEECVSTALEELRGD